MAVLIPLLFSALAYSPIQSHRASPPAAVPILSMELVLHWKLLLPSDGRIIV